MGLDLTVPEVIDLQVEIILAFSFVVDVLLQQVAQGSVLRWEVEYTVFAPLVACLLRFGTSTTND